MKDAVLVDVVRTASGRGKPGGALSWTHPVDLFAEVLGGLLARHDLDPNVVDDVIAGCVSQVGEQSANVARNAALAAGLPESVPGTTLDRQCGSGQQAVHFAAQGVLAGAYDVVIAGGVEVMSRVPLGTAMSDRDPFGTKLLQRYPNYPDRMGQGIAAEIIAARWGLDRAELDAFAARSHRRAAEAAASGHFAGEILPVDVKGADGELHRHERDETVRPSTDETALAALKPAFYEPCAAEQRPEIQWSITAGNSSPLTDGASAALIMSEERARQLGLTPRARFHAFDVIGDDPITMLTAPIPGTRRILKRAGLSLDDLDAYEVNEAFAAIPLAWARELDADEGKLNPCGGAIALGHPVGSSGTRILATLVRHLERTGGRYGLQTICEGGGMANSTIIEVL